MLFHFMMQHSDFFAKTVFQGNTVKYSEIQ